MMNKKVEQETPQGGEAGEVGGEDVGLGKGENPNPDDNGEAGGAEGDDDLVVSIDGEAPTPEEEEQAHAPSWVKELRKTNRELARQNRELQSKLQAPPAAEQKAPDLGPKPKLEDHDYDADKYEEALTGWFERKRQADEAKARQEAEVMTQQQAWQAKLDGYSKAKSELKVKDFEDAEAVTQELFNVTQQGIMVQGADNPALVVYALGKNPKKAQELAQIKDPVKFAFAVAKLERDLKVTSRKAAPPPPEKSLASHGRVSGAVDSTLERLREEAARTGDMTKVLRYKASKRSA
jgi:hypothetical protein